MTFTLHTDTDGPAAMTRFHLKTYMDSHHLHQWYVFGEHADGRVDVAQGDGPDVVQAVSREDAEKLIAARQEFIDKVCAILAVVA